MTDAHASFTDSDVGEDDDPVLEQSNFANLIATARQRNRAARGGGDSVQSPDTAGGMGAVSPQASGSLAGTSTPIGALNTVPSVVGMTGTPDQSIMIQKLLHEVDKMKAQQASFCQQAAFGEAINKTSKHIVDLLTTNKRSREEKRELPESPIMVTWSPRGEKALDDNHSTFSWSIRRLMKQPNEDPKVYWSKAKYLLKIEPNLRESLFLHHLMPLGLSSKALGWGHDLLATTSIKYYTHNQAVSGRKRKSNITLEEDKDNCEARIVTVGQEWAEASGLHEIAEAAHNWAAVRFQVAPWDWSGLLLLRVLHETSYFSTASEDEGSQRALAEKFIDEFLSKNRRNLMQGRPPLEYKKAMLLAEEVTRSYNGRQDRLWNKVSSVIMIAFANSITIIDQPVQCKLELKGWQGIQGEAGAGEQDPEDRGGEP